MDSSVSRAMTPDLFSGNEATLPDVNLNDEDNTHKMRLSRDGSRETTSSVDARTASRTSGTSAEPLIKKELQKSTKTSQKNVPEQTTDAKKIYKKLRKLEKQERYQSPEEDSSENEEEEMKSKRRTRPKKKSSSKVSST